ncbi:MAG: LytR family transcriptional regulator [Clostridia bacterium]|nr:LytR family transcriptional regulator [Clostridia bacterium]
MEQEGKEITMEEKTRGKRKANYVLAGIVSVLLVLFIGVYYTLTSLNRTGTEIVDGEAVLPPEEELESIEGTPKDIDEDYIYEVKDPESEAIYRKIPIDENVFNVLLVGSDVRGDEEGNGRSDSMMLVSYNRETSDIRIVSFMRDTWIAIPNREWNRINAAYAFGGIGLAVNTVNENFELDIQNYAIVEFEGLKSIVDTLGGIEVKLTTAEIRKINSAGAGDRIPLEEGTYVLNGDQVLVHSRNRSTGDGDFGRTRRQRDVMTGILAKMKETLNPVKLTTFITESLKYVDTNMKADTLFTLGLEVLGSGSSDLSQARVPFDDTWRYADKGGRSVVTIDLEENRRLLYEYLYEEKND